MTFHEHLDVSITLYIEFSLGSEPKTSKM